MPAPAANKKLDTEQNDSVYKVNQSSMSVCLSRIREEIYLNSSESDCFILENSSKRTECVKPTMTAK